MQDLNEYLTDQRWDTKTERELLKAIRKLPQDERYRILLPYLKSSPTALLFARKVSLRPSDYKAMWPIGLDCSDVSSIRFWISAIAPNIGWRKTLRLIQQEIDSGNRKIGKVIYYVPYIFYDIVPSSEDRMVFKELVQKAWDSNLLEFNPNSVWGGQWVA